jgi:predicted S18 family serine protease
MPHAWISPAFVIHTLSLNIQKRSVIYQQLNYKLKTYDTDKDWDEYFQYLYNQINDDKNIKGDYKPGTLAPRI